MGIFGPIEVQGRFLGVVVIHASVWRFIATDPAVEDIDGATFPSPAEAKRVAGLVVGRNRRLPTPGSIPVLIR
ncbi:MAG TPA: hypothetical protein VGC80_05515 [Acetobacteraceae bacterium]|jgi:hypothetical protein